MPHSYRFQSRDRRLFRLHSGPDRQRFRKSSFCGPYWEKSARIASTASRGVKKILSLSGMLK
jgi:hypothetical protein